MWLRAWDGVGEMVVGEEACLRGSYSMGVGEVDEVHGATHESEM